MSYHTRFPHSGYRMIRFMSMDVENKHWEVVVFFHKEEKPLLSEFATHADFDAAYATWLCSMHVAKTLHGEAAAYRGLVDKNKTGDPEIIEQWLREGVEVLPEVLNIYFPRVKAHTESQKGDLKAKVVIDTNLVDGPWATIVKKHVETEADLWSAVYDLMENQYETDELIEKLKKRFKIARNIPAPPIPQEEPVTELPADQFPGFEIPTCPSCKTGIVNLSSGECSHCEYHN